MILYLFSPLLITYYGIKYLFIFSDFNAIKNDEEFSGVKKGAFRTDFDLDKIKRFSKFYNCTVNDFWMANLSKSIQTYLKKR